MLSPKDIIASIQMEAAIGNFIPPRPEPIRIAAAAIRIGPMVYAAPPPARHIDVAMMLIAGGHDRTVLRRCLRCLRDEPRHVHVDDRAQGFLTTEAMFVNRYVAHRIAFRAGQTKWAPHSGSELTSEHVW